MNRRSFFRFFMAKAAGELEKRTTEIGQRIREAMGPEAFAESPASDPALPAAAGAAGTDAGSGPDQAAPDPEAPRYLRPPGALSGPAFEQTCQRSGDCVRACPVGAIVFDGYTAGALPHIIARQNPCVVCADLACMKACPSGALVPVQDRRLIHMGLAVVDQARCLRTAAGEDCRLCLASCPMGEDALGLDCGDMIEVRPACVGCGACEKACPTDPPSIWVEPAA